MGLFVRLKGVLTSGSVLLNDMRRDLIAKNGVNQMVRLHFHEAWEWNYGNENFKKFLYLDLFFELEFLLYIERQSCRKGKTVCAIIFLEIIKFRLNCSTETLLVAVFYSENPNEISSNIKAGVPLFNQSIDALLYVSRNHFPKGLSTTVSAWIAALLMNVLNEQSHLNHSVTCRDCKAHVANHDLYGLQEFEHY